MKKKHKHVLNNQSFYQTFLINFGLTLCIKYHNIDTHLNS